VIGTLICRNCDTVFEVSEGDVTKFKVHPVFTCSVCSSDLSPLMAGFVNGQGAKRDTEDEFTIPEDAEVFDGLPMGETFDQAAEKIRAGGAPPSELTPLLRVPEPTPISRSIALAEATPLMSPQPGEDPLSMALRIAAQAAALAATSPAAPSTGREGEDMPTGVLQWKPATVAAPVKAMATASASAAAAAPATNGDARSTEIGVVPEEPENESTLRGVGASTVTESIENSVVEPTEPTHPSPHEETPLIEREGTPYEEATPLLAALRAPDPDEDIIPDVRDDQPVAPPPSTEATPAVRSPVTPEPTPAMRAVPPTFTEAPREEVTIRKSSPPIALQNPRPLTVRSGNGPAGVGALGIRLAVGRPIVRPAFNGRAALAPHSDTAISGSNPIPRFEPVRTPSSGTRTPAPPPPSAIPGLGGAAARSPAANSPSASSGMRLALIGGGAFFGIGALALIVWAIFFHHPSLSNGATPTPAETSVAVASLAPPPSTATPTAVEATPTAGRPTPTPRNAGTASVTSATPRPTPTQAAPTPVARTSIAPTTTSLVALATPIPTPTKVALATPISTPRLMNTPTAVATVKTPSPSERSKAALERFDAEFASSPSLAPEHLINAVRHDNGNEELVFGAFMKFRFHADMSKFARETGDDYRRLPNAPAQKKTSVEDWFAKNPQP
jgi:hypothetical protein